MAKEQSFELKFDYLGLLKRLLEDSISYAEREAYRYNGEARNIIGSLGIEMSERQQIETKVYPEDDTEYPVDEQEAEEDTEEWP